MMDDATARETLESEIWGVFPDAGVSQVDIILRAADRYAEACAQGEMAEPFTNDGPTARFLAEEHRAVLEEALGERGSGR